MCDLVGGFFFTSRDQKSFAQVDLLSVVATVPFSSLVVGSFFRQSRWNYFSRCTTGSRGEKVEDAVGGVPLAFEGKYLESVLFSFLPFCDLMKLDVCVCSGTLWAKLMKSRGRSREREMGDCEGSGGGGPEGLWVQGFTGKSAGIIFFFFGWSTDLPPSPVRRSPWSE